MITETNNLKVIYFEIIYKFVKNTQSHYSISSI